MSDPEVTPRKVQLFCTECGAVVAEAASFCVSCGRPLTSGTEVNNQSAVSLDSSLRSPRRILRRPILVILAFVTLLGVVGFVIGIHVLQTAKPEILSLSPTTSALPTAGGTIQLSGQVSDARSCIMRQVPVQNVVSVSLSQPAENCAHDRFRARVSIGPNVLQKVLRLHFQIVAHDGKAKSHPRRFTIDVYPATAQPSSNWAGYVQKSSKRLTFVSAHWTIPEMHCASGNGGLAAWIGVDGRPELNSEFRSGNNLFQAGSESECSQGQQYDFMWWEWNPVNLSNDVLAVNPGDAVFAEVFYQTINSQTGWWWYVDDTTTGQSLVAPSPVPYDGPATTEDFIVEDPGVFGSGNSTQPFVGFSPITFTRMLVATNSPPVYQPFSFDSFEAGGVVNMVHRVGRSLRVLAEGSMPGETNDGYGKMTVTYSGP
jgi:xanthosine utilization system XapX-like protein